MAQELAVHRHDAEAGAGDPHPIDAEVAADGIDEFLDVFCGIADFSEPPGTLHLHATDGDGEWFVDTTTGALTWERAHAKGDVAVRGATSDLLLLLWGRVSPDQVEVLGDEQVLTRFRELTQF
jgi:hypothetical protein